MSTEPGQEPTSEAAFFTTIRSWGLVRSDHRVAGGVISGVGSRIGLAPTPARIIFVVIAIFTSGLALLAYAAAWALLPDTKGTIVIQDFGRGRPNVGALVVIAILAIAGFASLDNIGKGGPWNWQNGPWIGFDGQFGDFMGRPAQVLAVILAVVIPLVILGGIAALIVWAVRSSKNADRSAQGFARMPDGSLPTAPASPQAGGEEGAAAPQPADAPIETATFAAQAAPASATYAPPVYTAPPAPRSPRVRGPGAMGYLMALALIPISAAAVLYLHSTDQLAVYAPIAAGTIYVAGLGLILIITALRGRKLGFLGFVSVIALIPVGLSIAFATDIREQYATGGEWRGWVHEEFGPQWDAAPEPSYSEEVPPPAFDPSALFTDYTTVVIAGQCELVDQVTPSQIDGNVSLSELTGPMSVTIATASTRVVIPSGTNLVIKAPPETGYERPIGVTWLDRDVTCGLTAGVGSVVTLNNPDAPVVTLELSDTAPVDSFNIYIEEN